MALQTQFSTYFTTKTHHSFSPILIIRSEKPSEPSDSVPKNSGVGFGSSKVNTKRKQKGKRERASIIRRNPVEKPALVKEQEPVQQEEEQGAYENAFILAWLGFGSVILVEGLALAASGIFPEEWDKIFVKYLYPSFTPTVFLFVAGAIAFGVVKYKQNEKLTERK
ncbi:protein LPA2-like [Vicia villosa]|uniref:protein LPA2-like n=1 Tax=Vicia villosa TaxID=3911 RepID=UPI00273B8035|nr:protein LPA2-like [Vicia villosa]XP_058767983.1 protein LPA2-like [Vicia villosa]